MRYLIIFLVLFACADSKEKSVENCADANYAVSGCLYGCWYESWYDRKNKNIIATKLALEKVKLEQSKAETIFFEYRRKNITKQYLKGYFFAKDEDVKYPKNIINDEQKKDYRVQLMKKFTELKGKIKERERNVISLKKTLADRKSVNAVKIFYGANLKQKMNRSSDYIKSFQQCEQQHMKTPMAFEKEWLD